MTGAGGADLDARRALLELLLAEEGVAPTAPDLTIPRRDPDVPAVLSFAQERLWFLHQFDDDTAALNIRIGLRLRGPLDIDALAAAVDDVVARQATLRTCVVMVDGAPHPRRLEQPPTPFSYGELAPVDDPAARITEILAEEGARRFDLERDVPMHVRVVRIAADEHLVSLVVHHIAADGLSMRIIGRDLAACYGERIGRAPAGLDDLVVEYDDYAAWQREFVSGERYERQLEHWRTTLARPLPLSELPPDHQRPRRHVFAGGQIAHTIGREDAEALRELARRASGTPFMVLLAALDVLIGRRAGIDDIIVGTPVAGRVRPELANLVGVFLNMLPLRADLSGDPSFEELLERVRDACLDAFDNQDIAFEQLLAELSPDRDVSRTPLFQVLFNMMTFEERSGEAIFAGVDVELIGQADLAAKFDLTVYVDEQPDLSLQLLFVYNRALYRPDTMRQLVEQYVTLLQGIAAAPERPISAYSLVTPEAERLLPSATEPLDDSWHGSVVDALRRHASESPERPAVEWAGGTVSYGELVDRVDAVAEWVRREAGGGDAMVAVHAHRDPALVWTLLGVLAAGGAYVVVDPAYPPARLVQHLRIARPTGWLAVPGAGPVDADVVAALDELAVDARAQVAELPAAPAEARVAVAIGPDDVACLTFTSGSTGVPKAVVGRHGSLSHFLPWQTRRFGITAADRFSMLSGIAHDPLQRDIFWALWAGATIVVPDPAQLGSPGWLAGWLHRTDVTVAHLTPAMGRLVTEHAGRIVTPLLRHVQFIGDVLTPADVVRLRSMAPGVTVTNLYGTTETQRASGYHVVGDDDLTAGTGTLPARVLPIGQGMDGSSQVLVRTAAGGPVGFGEIGEIWMRSPHLAAGYLDQPALTAERLLTLAPGDGSRVYRTGDRGRYRADGVVEYLGRDDGQVQLRGFRIETAEIRAALLHDASVRDAAVILHGEAEPALAAYVVVDEDSFDAAAARARLRVTLPAHMVPRDIVVVERIPISPAGKLDRSALPAPQAVARVMDAEPADGFEERLLEWFRTVLSRRDVGVHDNFFDLGGYSLLATRLFALIENETGRHIPVATLFDAPTVATLADVIRRGVQTSKWTSLVPVQPGGSQLPFFYVAPYVSSVLEFARLGTELGPDQPLYGFQPQGLDGRAAVHDRIEDMAAHYIDEMRSVQPLGPYRIGGHCSGSWVAFEMARQLEAAGDELDTIVLVDQGPPGVVREYPSRTKYVWRRARFYLRDGRLFWAIVWQVKLRARRRLARRVAPRAMRQQEMVRATHRAAYLDYAGGPVHHELVLIRSDESIMLEDRTWYLDWAKQTTSTMRLTHTPGNHSSMLKQGYVHSLAECIRWAFDPSRPDPGAGDAGGPAG